MSIFLKVIKWVLITAIVVLGLLFLLAVFYSTTADTPRDKEISQEAAIVQQPAIADVAETPQALDWNRSDANALTNGNIAKAISLVREGAKIEKTPVEKAGVVLRKPWDYYGKNICIRGDVNFSTDYPPDGDLSKAFGVDKVSEVVIRSGQDTIVSLLNPSSAAELTVWTSITACGFVVGRSEDDDGDERIIMVGNFFL